MSNKIYRSGDEAVKDVLRQALEGSVSGTQASGQTQGQIKNPHSSSSNPFSHVDFWGAAKEVDGSVSFKKWHG